MEERKIPKRNYVFLGIIMLISILLIFYFYLWFLAYEESKLNTKIINRYLEVINYNELDSYIAENKNAYIYVSKLEDENIRDFEKRFKTTIMDNSLNGKVLYLDISNELKNTDTYNDMLNLYSINGDNITNVPCILIFKDGLLVSIYDIKTNSYNTKGTLDYLKDNGVLE